MENFELGCDFRFIKLTLAGIKNVEGGELVFKGSNNALLENDASFPIGEVLGIYGPNGSGKTAAILCMYLLQHIVRDQSLTRFPLLDSLPCKWMETSCVEYELYVEINHALRARVNYKVFFKSIEDHSKGPFQICKEQIQFNVLEEKGYYASFPNCKISLDYESDSTDISNVDYFKSSALFGRTIESKTKNMAKLLSIKQFGVSNCQFMLLSDQFASFLHETSEMGNVLRDVLLRFRHLIRTRLFVHTTVNDAYTSLGKGTIHALARDNEHDRSIMGVFACSTEGPFDILLEDKPLYENILEQINVLVASVIPGFETRFISHGIRAIEGDVDENGEPRRVESIEIVRDVEKGVIPLSCESAGIRKFVNLAGALIRIYNNPSTILVVDEMDSGVFEYLLGQMLQALKGAKGQLMFSCHNLRPVEVLHGEQMYFTTLNMKRRYIHLTGIKANNNARTTYLRAVQLGGQKEDLYEETNVSEIQRALRRGGKVTNERE